MTEFGIILIAKVVFLAIAIFFTVRNYIEMTQDLEVPEWAILIQAITTAIFVALQWFV